MFPQRDGSSYNSSRWRELEWIRELSREDTGAYPLEARPRRPLPWPPTQFTHNEVISRWQRGLPSPCAWSRERPPSGISNYDIASLYADSIDTSRGPESELSAEEDSELARDMATLQVRGADFSATKQKAFEDAKKMQASVEEQCNKSGKDVPPYILQELIGKGSFGRVYKATDLNSSQVVAVKIIDIEESDTLNPKLADTYSEFLKEINALKLLSEGGARNINHILDALPVGQSMWMVTEYCAGGSVATLMRPTAPGGLQEKWIIPIVREVAEALFWVHKQGIVHRDLKCANVFVTESGSVQLGDFGVSGVIETKFDKRSTFIGTPHWMAPELFDPSASYGVEVDIWAFGSMIYEIAEGLPPNALAGVDVTQLGSYIKSHTPRLASDRYSDALKDIVSFCLVEDPAQRPTIEQVQQHPYIFNTSTAFPASSLARLVQAYRAWEAQGGIRKSLFAMGGAQGPTDFTSTALANDEWNFSTTVDFDQRVMNNTDAQAVYDVYGQNVDFQADNLSDDMSRGSKRSRRRPPPQQLAAMRVPLERVFDPNTISNYEDNSRLYYNKPLMPPASDLPLRDDSLHATLRESLIDLDASLHGSELSRFADMETIRAAPRESTDYETIEIPDFSRPPNSDPEMLNNNRKTQEWKFPSMVPPASANPELSRFPFHENGPSGTPNSASRPPLLHHPTDPVGLPSQGYELAVPRAQDNRMSTSSLIDLDESLPDPMPDLTRPSTSHSDAGSIAGSDVGAFDLERHASLYQPMPAGNREPSIYVSDDSDFARLAAGPGFMNDMRDMNSERDRRATANFIDDADLYTGGDYMESEYMVSDQGQPFELQNGQLVEQGNRPLPPIPGPPLSSVMSGSSDSEETRSEFLRMLGALGDHLNYTGEFLANLPVRKAGPRQEMQSD